MLLTATTASAQFLRSKPKPADTPAAAPADPDVTRTDTTADQIPIQGELTRRLVDPGEPIARVNGEPISRQELADECVARKGEEILESLIARKLIDQAIKAAHCEVTAGEVDAEIERVAQSIAGVSREKWLATLAKERKISPSQYARDIIYPALALRKLAAPHVEVTEQDMKNAFEAHFGERLQCRMIMLNSLPIAKQVWEQLKESPLLFEKLAQQRSIDPSTRSVGGMLPEPIARHSSPRPVSDAAFEQLVDGVALEGGRAGTNDAQYKPKDGEISGIIQVTEATWIILRRESVLPARPHDPKDPALRDQIRGAIMEGLVQEKIGEIYGELMRQAAIENLLTGQIKPAGNEELSAAQIDGSVQLMAAPGEAQPLGQTEASAAQAVDGTGAASAADLATPPPAVIRSGDAARAAELLKRAP